MTGRSYAHGDSRVAMINSRSLVYISPVTAPTDQYRITTGTYCTTNKTQCPPLDHAFAQNPKYQSPGKYQNIKENNLI